MDFLSSLFFSSWLDVKENQKKKPKPVFDFDGFPLPSTLLMLFSCLWAHACWILLHVEANSWYGTRARLCEITFNVWTATRALSHVTIHSTHLPVLDVFLRKIKLVSARQAGLIACDAILLLKASERFRIVFDCENEKWLAESETQFGERATPHAVIQCLPSAHSQPTRSGSLVLFSRVRCRHKEFSLLLGCIQSSSSEEFSAIFCLRRPCHWLSSFCCAIC